jgi:hypothetical protein
MKYRFSKTLPLKCSVLFSEKDIPSNYREDDGTFPKSFFSRLTGIVKWLATLDLDLKSLGDGAFTLYRGTKGDFYQVKFDLELVFGTVVTLQLKHNNKVVKIKPADYVLNEAAPAYATTSQGLNIARGATQTVGHWQD